MENRYTNFTRLLLNISRSIQKIKNAEMEKLGFRGNQVEVLFALSQSEEGLKFTDLCKVCDEDKAGISRMVKDLTLKGLLEQEGGSLKYKNKIKLTAKGKETGKFIATKISTYIEEASTGVSDKERENLYKILAKISNNLSSLCEKGE